MKPAGAVAGGFLFARPMYFALAISGFMVPQSDSEPVQLTG